MDDHCVNGKVAAVDDEHIVVALDSENACKSCGMNGMCANKTIELDRTKQSGSFSMGQHVRLEYEKVFQTSLIIYMIPIIFFFSGIALSRWLFNIQEEMVQFLSAMGATALSFLLVRYLNRVLGDSSYKVHIKPIN